MATASSSRTGVFRREPGDWTCHQCNEVNFKSRTACRRCSTPRNQTTQASIPAATATSQIVTRPGDWTCSSCKNVNFAARITCHQCGRSKQEPMEVDAPRSAVVQKPGDWKCSSCPEMNFGSRVVCRSCGAARSTTEKNKQSECVICMERPIDSVITSCGHSAVCLQCGAGITQCPICRGVFNPEQIIKLFNVH